MTAFDSRALDLISENQPAWRVEQMASAWAGFDAQELPTGAEEEWRYVDLGVDLDRMSPATEEGEPLADDDFVRLARQGALAASVTIVDGRVQQAESSGVVSIRRLAELDGLRPAAPVDRDKLAAAHLAFARDGVRVEVGAREIVEAPILIDVQSTRAGVMSFPHVELAVGAEAEAGFLLVHRSPDGVEMASVPGVTLEADNGGRIRYQAVQNWGDATVGVVHQKVRLGRDATGWIGDAGLGGRVGRLDLHAALEGAGSSAQIVGLYFGEGDQTLDYRMLIDHIGRSTSSDVFLKGAVEDNAQSIFTGLLRIEKGAVRSSAFETNRNLVLSENAKAHSVPNLEILCDDVVCGHGSSVGPLEDEYLYYLQSRGISQAKAERMLIRGFFTEVIDRLPIDVVGRPIQDAVFRRFVRAQEGGRLS